MDEQSSSGLSVNDRAFLETTDALADLKRHPAWAVYETEILDEVIRTLKNMLFNEDLSDIGQVKGIRAALRAFYLVKGKPQEMITAARDVRQSMGMPERDRQ